MSITAPEGCYHAQLKQGGDPCASSDAGSSTPPPNPVLTFRLVALTTPQRTDGTVEVVVSSRSGAFADQKLPPISATLDSAPPQNVVFDFILPEGTNSCGLFELSLRAQAGKNQYAGVIATPCQ